MFAVVKKEYGVEFDKMAKTYLDTVKYLVKANFEVDGLVEKPDIVGAVFGQTEGLLGDDLDLRELQKSGRIGRIEVDMNVRGGKSRGTIVVPSSLDMVETSILAAALEVVDRIGPCDARISVTRIEDSRNAKRKIVLDRARLLLKSLLTSEIPESKELTELVREDVKKSEISVYGEDKLPAGPAIASSDAIIFVEGRADVLNLLRNNIENTVAIGGANVGKTIVKLGQEKEVTVFLDGDRGGDIILKELMHATDVDFVARAPVGKEVEELTRKELIKCLRRRVPVEQAESATQQLYRSPASAGFSRSGDTRAFSRPAQSQGVPPVPTPLPAKAQSVSSAPVPQDNAEALKVKNVLKELAGTLRARLVDPSMGKVSEVPIREIMKTLGGASQAYGVILDGIVTQRLVDLAEQKGAKYVVGLRAGNLSRKPSEMRILLAE